MSVDDTDWGDPCPHTNKVFLFAGNRVDDIFADPEGTYSVDELMDNNALIDPALVPTVFVPTAWIFDGFSFHLHLMAFLLEKGRPWTDLNRVTKIEFHDTDRFALWFSPEPLRQRPFNWYETDQVLCEVPLDLKLYTWTTTYPASEDQPCLQYTVWPETTYWCGIPVTGSAGHKDNPVMAMVDWEDGDPHYCFRLLK